MSVVSVESYLRVSESGIVAAAALLAFDYCLTFGKEVEWMYGTRWSAARIHFSASRYLPFVAITLGILTSRVLPPSETDYCGTLGTASNIMYYLCIVLSEAILIVRTYAFWKRDRKILIGMCTFGMVCMVVAIVVSQTISPQSGNPKTVDCISTQSSVAEAIEYLCLILYEMGMLILNWIAFRKVKRQSPPGRLITTLYRDGVMYVAAILVFSVINAVVTLATPLQYSDILNSPQMVMHSILASRIFFNLRETTRREERISIATPLTEFRATPQGSSAFGSSFGTSTFTSSRIDPTKTTDTTGITEVAREAVVPV